MAQPGGDIYIYIYIHTHTHTHTYIQYLLHVYSQSDVISEQGEVKSVIVEY